MAVSENSIALPTRRRVLGHGVSALAGAGVAAIGITTATPTISTELAALIAKAVAANDIVDAVQAQLDVFEGAPRLDGEPRSPDQQRQIDMLEQQLRTAYDVLVRDEGAVQAFETTSLVDCIAKLRFGFDTYLFDLDDSASEAIGFLLRDLLHIARASGV